MVDDYPYQKIGKIYSTRAKSPGYDVCHRAVASYSINVYVGGDLYWRCL